MPQSGDGCKNRIERQMEIDNAETPKLSAPSELSKVSVEADRSPRCPSSHSNTSSLAERSVSTLEIGRVSGTHSLSSGKANLQLTTVSRHSKLKIEPFRSLREFHLKKRDFNSDRYVTDESAACGPFPQTARGVVSRSTNANSNTVPIGLIQGFLTLPLNTTLSSFVGTKYKPYKNYSFSLLPSLGPDTTTDVSACKDLQPESNSSGSPALTETPNPCQGLSCGPHLPPRPAETYHPQRKATPAIFHDQFTQFMEDRMMMFRPPSSQNNVEQSLNSNHPYQHIDEPETAHLRSWFTLSSNRNVTPRIPSQVVPTPEVSAVSPRTADPINNSTSSFLPRGVERPCSANAEISAMMYTPRAVPLTDLKRPPPSPIRSQCMCVWWPF